MTIDIKLNIRVLAFVPRRSAQLPATQPMKHDHVWSERLKNTPQFVMHSEFLFQKERGDPTVG
ncbi:hypothetical protein D3C81_2062900 [compost metagenome]